MTNCNKEEFGGEFLEHLHQLSLQWGCQTPRPPAAEPAHQAPASCCEASPQVTTKPGEPPGYTGFSVPAPPRTLGMGLWQSVSSHSCTVSFTKHLSLHFGLSSLGGKCHGNNWISKKCTCKTIKDCEGCLPLILPSTGQINFTFRRRRSK